jgi:hypothetical protein
MASFGIAVVKEGTPVGYYSGPLKPTGYLIDENAIKVHGLDYEERKAKGKALVVAIAELEKFVENNNTGRPVFISDNLAFDWQFINFASHFTLERNIFGHSGRRIGDIYSGWIGRTDASSWKKYRITRHTHNPLDDAMGNVEALLELRKQGMPVILDR